MDLTATIKDLIDNGFDLSGISHSCGSYYLDFINQEIPILPQLLIDDNNNSILFRYDGILVLKSSLTDYNGFLGEVSEVLQNMINKEHDIITNAGELITKYKELMNTINK